MILRKITALFLHIYLLSPSLCVPFNVSIDDTFGDERNGNQISYTPTDGWKQGQTCTDCTARVDANQPFRRTWHDATFLPENMGGDGIIRSASVSFNGTAVYVICILTGSSTSPDGNTDMRFLVDGNRVDGADFERSPTGDTTFRYNQIVFSHDGLPFGAHSIQIDVGHNNTKALILLDRILYTSDSDVVSPSSPLPQLSISEVVSTPTSTSVLSGAHPSLHSNFLCLFPLVFFAGALRWLP